MTARTTRNNPLRLDVVSVTTGATLVLRTLDWLTDATPEYLAMLREAAPVLGAEHLPSSIEALRSDIAARERPGTHLLGIFDADQTRHVGNIQLRIDAPHRRAEVGIVVGSAFRRRHVALLAHIAVLDWAFATTPLGLGLHKVDAGHRADNNPAELLYRRLGFDQEAYLSDHQWLNGAFHDVVRVGVLDDQWGFLRTGAEERPMLHPLMHTTVTTLSDGEEVRGW